MKHIILLLTIKLLFLANCYFADGKPWQEPSAQYHSNASDSRPIYFWLMMCSLLGDMQTQGLSGGSLESCSSSITGITSANALCESRYETDAGTQKDREEVSAKLGSSPTHQALLATLSQDPRAFPIDAKENRAVVVLTMDQGPSHNPVRGGLLIDGYHNLFDPQKELLRPILNSNRARPQAVW